MKRANSNAISPVTNIILNVIFLIGLVLCVYPVILILGISISDEHNLVKYGYQLFPTHNITTYAYTFIFKWAYTLVNSYVLTIGVTIAGAVTSTLLIALYAYPLSRKEFRFRKHFSFYAMFTMLFNGGVISWYIVNVKVLHIDNTVWALILPYLMNAFYVLIMRTFYKTSIPDAVIESAKIDGSGEFRSFFTIVFPLAIPGIATIALFSTLQYWNDYFLPLYLVSDSRLYNLQFMMYKTLENIRVLQTINNPDVDDLVLKLPGESARMAMCILSIGPIIFAYPFFQKYFIKGLTIGAVKG
jgi:putative aldouronate transport system permease protein